MDTTVRIDLIYLVMAAFGAIGFLEWLKGFSREAPSWLWRLLMPVICLGTAIAGDGGPFQIATITIILVAMTQLCYDLIVVKAKELLFGQKKEGS